VAFGFANRPAARGALLAGVRELRAGLALSMRHSGSGGGWADRRPRHHPRGPTAAALVVALLRTATSLNGFLLTVAVTALWWLAARPGRSVLRACSGTDRTRHRLVAEIAGARRPAGEPLPAGDGLVRGSGHRGHHASSVADHGEPELVARRAGIRRVRSRTRACPSRSAFATIARSRRDSPGGRSAPRRASEISAGPRPGLLLDLPTAAATSSCWRPRS
jgi:hypothetical protein